MPLITGVFILLILLVIILRRRSTYNNGRIRMSWVNEIGVTGVVDKWVLTVRDYNNEKYTVENSVDVYDSDTVVMQIDNIPYSSVYLYNLSYVRKGSLSSYTMQEGELVQNDQKMITTNAFNDIKQRVTYVSDCVAEYVDDPCPFPPGHNEPNCGQKAKTTRRWTILQEPLAVGKACPPPTEEVECGTINPCGSCDEQAWGEWSVCDTYTGYKTRYRSPTVETFFGCGEGDERTNRMAIENKAPCDVDCVGRWVCSECQLAPGKVSGDGSQLQKVCKWEASTTSKNNGIACPNEDMIVSDEDRELPIPGGGSTFVGKCPSPVNCSVSYSDGPCEEQPCGGNQRYLTRTYKVDTNPLNNGLACNRANNSTEKWKCGSSPMCYSTYYATNVNFPSSSSLRYDYFDETDLKYIANECAKLCDDNDRCQGFKIYVDNYNKGVCHQQKDQNSVGGDCMNARVRAFFRKDTQVSDAEMCDTHNKNPILGTVLEDWDFLRTNK